MHKTETFLESGKRNVLWDYDFQIDLSPMIRRTGKLIDKSKTTKTKMKVKVKGNENEWK